MQKIEIVAYCSALGFSAANELIPPVQIAQPIVVMKNHTPRTRSFFDEPTREIKPVSSDKTAVAISKIEIKLT